MAFAGLMLPPVLGYLLVRMEELTAGLSPWRRKLVRMGVAASRYACFGLIALALIPQYRVLDALHQIAGVFAFGGLYITVLFLWSIPLWGTSLGFTKTSLITLGACWAPVGFLITQGYRYAAYGEIGDQIKTRHESLLLRFSFWEWLLYFCLMFSLVVYVSVLPRKNS